MTTFTIRQATAEDAAELARLLTALGYPVTLESAAATVSDSDSHQMVRIKGVVKGPKGPLPGAIVQVKNTQVLAVSAANGKFELEIPTPAATVELVCSYAGLAEDKHHTGSLSDGEIRKVDKDAKKITIKHGPLQNLDMPAMTMVFQVKDPAFLDQVKAGDMVKFEAQKLGGAYTVTRIEAAK